MPPAQALPTAAADDETAARLKAGRGLTCTNNSEDRLFYADQAKLEGEDAEDEDVEVDVVERGLEQRWEAVKGDEGATECSSSFGETFSEAGGGGGESEGEVESWYAENGDSVLLDGSNGEVKKKKVTDHWRKFIRPISWRCQWLELRMRELHSQAIRYDKELEAYKTDKQLRSRDVRLGYFASRSVPLAQSQKKQAMRRRKRKRNEDIVDVSSYLLNHNVFSYYENRRPETDLQSVDDGCDDLADEKVNDNLEWSILRFRRSDSALEQILLEIESTQSRVLELRSRLNEVTSNNNMEIPSTQAQIFPEGLPVGCAFSHCISPDNLGDGAHVGGVISPAHHQSDYETEDMVRPGSAASSYGDAAEIALLDSTMGKFSAAELPLDQHDIAGYYKAADDDVLIDNQAAEEGRQTFEMVSHLLEKPRVMIKEEAEEAEEAESSSEEEEPSTSSEYSIPEPCGGSVKSDLKPTTVIKACHNGKKRGRKPRRKRRGVPAGGSGGARNTRSKSRRLG